MSLSIPATDIYDQQTQANIDRIPDLCPHCNQGGHPTAYKAYLNGQTSGSTKLQLVCRCPRAKCNLTYLALYEGLDLMGGFFFK
jgi:hypothetical protein